ncbi:MAG: hypothetical protein SAqBPW_33410 [Shewanella algae]
MKISTGSITPASQAEVNGGVFAHAKTVTVAEGHVHALVIHFLVAMHKLDSLILKPDRVYNRKYVVC